MRLLFCVRCSVSRLLRNVNASKAAQTEEGGVFLNPGATHIIEC